MDPGRWSSDPDALALVPALLLAYLLAQRVHPAPLWRVVSFASGCVLLLAVLITPVDTIALHYLLSMHLLQNVALAEWAPGLCVLGLSPSLARLLERLPTAGFFTRPPVALGLWLATYYAWHLPWPYDAALRHQATLLHLEHACYFATGCLMWWPVIHGRLSSGGKAAYLFAAFVLAGPLGLVLALVPSPVYSFYEDAPRLWGLSPLADQQIAGVTMSAEQAVVLFAAFAYFVKRFLDEEERRDVSRVSSFR